MINTSNLQIPSTFNRNIKKNSNLQVSKNNGETIFEKKMSKYVEVKNGEYVLNPIIYSQNISIQDISRLQNILNKSNKTIKMLHITNLNVENGNSLSNNSLKNSNNVELWEMSRGINGIQFFWWGFYLYLNSTYTQMLINTGGAAYGAVIGGALGTLSADPLATIGGAVVGGMIGSAISTYGDNSSEAYYGCVCSYNYALGVQEVWTQ